MTRGRSGIRFFDDAEERTSHDRARWHRTLLAGLSLVPDPCYLGGYRGSAHPWLAGYEVVVGMHDGVAPARVAQDVGMMLLTLGARIADLSRSVAPGQWKSADEMERVAELAAWAHGDWVRIHPFANGNGRVARLLANYVLVRFRMAPVVRLKPRPGEAYEAAARASMRGDHVRMKHWLVDQLKAKKGGH